MAGLAAEMVKILVPEEEKIRIAKPRKKELHFYYDSSLHIDMPRKSMYTRSIEVLGIILLPRKGGEAS